MPNTEKENPAKLRMPMYAPVAGFSFSYYPSRLSQFLQRFEGMVMLVPFLFVYFLLYTSNA